MEMKKQGKETRTNEVVDMNTNIQVFTINGNELNVLDKTVGLS